MTLCGQSHVLTEIRPCVLAVTVSKLNGNMVIVVSGHLLKSEMQVSRLPGPGILLCSTSMCYPFPADESISGVVEPSQISNKQSRSFWDSRAF